MSVFPVLRRLRDAPAAPTRPAGGDSTARYDAFVSYSHAVDGRLAPALQAGLHRFAKPWYRLRALRVFRDEASLSANPALWSSIVAALEDSRWLVLLASPEAAASEWVAREVEHWRGSKSADRILFVLTGGEIEWDDDAGDFDWAPTTALPPTIRGVLAEEPRFVDVRWARSADDVSLANARFRDAVADVAATLHGRPKDELLGEDVRQHRRTRRLVRAVVATLAVLLAAAVAAAVIAFDQRHQARAERDRAEEQARLALSRQLAAEAAAAADDQLDLGLLLAAQAQAIRPTAQARSGLLQVLLRSPHLGGYLVGTTGSRQLAFDQDGRLLAVGGSNGSVVLWDPALRRRLRALRHLHGAEVTELAFSDDGRRLISGAADGTVAVWETPTGRLLRKLDIGKRILGAALDGPGARAAATSEGTATVVWDVATGKRLPALPFGRTAPVHLAFSAPDVLVVADSQGEIERWDLGNMPPTRERRLVGGGQPLASAYSPGVRLFAGVPLGQERPYLVDVRTGKFLSDLKGPTVSVDDIAFSGDGRLLATAGDGRVVLWNMTTREALADVLSGIPGQRRPMALALSRDGRRVAAAGARGVAVWDRRGHTLVRPLRTKGARPLSDVPNVVRGSSSAAFSPNGQLLAWSVLPSEGELVVVWDLARGREIRRFPSLLAVGFSPDGRRVAGKSFDEIFTVVDLGTGERQRTRTLPWKAMPRGASGPPQGRPWSVTSTTGLGASIAFDGTVTLWDVERRQPLTTIPIPGAFDFSYLAFDPHGRSLAVATAGGALSVVDVDPAAWREAACALVPRSLTAEERRLHLGGEDVPPACT